MNKDKMLTNALLSYSKNLTLRAAVSLIPYAGGAIEVLLSGGATRIQNQRVEIALKALKNEMDKANDEQVNKEYFSSEEFYDDFNLFLEKALKTKSQQKIMSYARILKSKSIEKIKSMDLTQLINSIADLSENELIILQKMYHYTIDKEKIALKNNGAPMATDFNATLVRNLVDERCQLSIDYDYILIRLEKQGFVKEDVGTYAGYSGGSYFITNATRVLFSNLEDK